MPDFRLQEFRYPADIGQQVKILFSKPILDTTLSY